MTTPQRGFSGPVQLNGIGRMHVKVPLAAANGHEWSRSTFHNQGQTTTPETSCPTLYDKRVGSFTSPANHFNTEDAGDGAYGL